MDRSVTATLLAATGFRELWIAGGVANAMLWLEVLAAGLFTFQATGSGLAVAIVSAARSFPLLLTGAFIGVLSETVNRKRIVVGGLVLTGITSVSVSALRCTLTLACSRRRCHQWSCVRDRNAGATENDFGMRR
jgi:hypothetical protein